MHVHLPKPPHGWREFAGEVGIIVLGVLIALGAEQLIGSLHERHVAAEARQNVRNEAATNLQFVQGRLRAQDCIAHRLEELQALLARSGDGNLAVQPTWVSRPPTGPFFFGRWQAATASGRNSLFSPDEQNHFSQLYALFSRLNDLQVREQTVWAQLRALEWWQGPLGPQGRLTFAQELEEAKYLAWDLRYSAAFALLNGRRMGLVSASRTHDDESICLPMVTPRAEGLKLSKNRSMGEP